MIINGLGNTFQDITQDLNTGNAGNVPATFLQGLADGDGWAYVMGAVGAWLIWKTYSKASSGVGRVQGYRAGRRAKVAKSLALDEEIKALQAKRKS